MIFDTSYFNGISLFPLNHDYFVLQQESYFFDVGNEIGLIKVLVEGGVILGIYILYFIIKKVKFYAVFLLFTLLHYSFFINVPIVLFLAIKKPLKIVP